MRRDEIAAEAAARKWLAFVGLGEAADRVAAAMPVGHQRLIEVARALATEPEVLLLDEPAAGLNATETRALGGYVRSIAAMGVAVLLVEHDMSMVMSIADQVYVLDQGRKIAEGTPAEVGSDPLVVTAYLGTVHE
jgi:ABC-type branched-subunit amino acid transport system ATPase component